VVKNWGFLFSVERVLVKTVNFFFIQEIESKIHRKRTMVGPLSSNSQEVGGNVTREGNRFTFRENGLESGNY